MKRYSGPEAWLKWSEELGDYWVDLPIEPDGSLDLRPLKRIWNMENCYVRASFASARFGWYTQVFSARSC